MEFPYVPRKPVRSSCCFLLIAVTLLSVSTACVPRGDAHDRHRQVWRQGIDAEWERHCELWRRGSDEERVAALTWFAERLTPGTSED